MINKHFHLFRFLSMVTFCSNLNELEVFREIPALKYRNLGKQNFRITKYSTLINDTFSLKNKINKNPTTILYFHATRIIRDTKTIVNIEKTIFLVFRFRYHPRKFAAYSPTSCFMSGFIFHVSPYCC